MPPTKTPPPMPKDVAEAVKQFGPFKLIDRKRESALLKQGKYRHIFTLVSYERAYEDLPEDDRPTDEELEERGESKEDFTQGAYEGVVGHHLVNVSEIYESRKPMPEDLRIEDDGIWFEEDGLPAP